MFHILADMFDGFFFFLKHFSGSCFWNFMFSPNFVVNGKINLIFSNGKINLIFSNEKMHKVQMPKVQMHKLQMSILVIHHYQLLISQFLKILLKNFSNEKMYKVQMHKLQMSMLVIHHHQLLISQFLKILLKDFEELMAMNLILIHWNMIMDCVIRYKNMMLIAKMKFKEFTLKLVHINLRSQTTTVSDYHGPPIKYSGSVPGYIYQIRIDLLEFLVEFQILEFQILAFQFYSRASILPWVTLITK
jgi:hypothetical protein